MSPANPGSQAECAQCGSEPGRSVEREAIIDCLRRYARGVDRGDWELVRSTYHPDAFDNHGGSYVGGVDGLIAWLQETFAEVDSGCHMLGQSLVEFVDGTTAVAETYFTSVRFSQEGLRQSWGRYVDEFTDSSEGWVVRDRRVVIDVASTSADAASSGRAGEMKGRRDDQDWLHRRRRELGLS